MKKLKFNKPLKNDIFKFSIVGICTICLLIGGIFLCVPKIKQVQEAHEEQLRVEEEERQAKAEEIRVEAEKIKLANEKKEAGKENSEYRNKLEGEIIDFQVYRKPREKYLHILHDDSDRNRVKFPYWVDYDSDTNSVVVHDEADNEGTVEDIENEIKGEYSLVKGLKVSDKIGLPSHATIVVYLCDENCNKICILASYKDGEFTTNMLSSQAEMKNGHLWYNRKTDLVKRGIKRAY